MLRVLYKFARVSAPVVLLASVPLARADQPSEPSEWQPFKSPANSRSPANSPSIRDEKAQESPEKTRDRVVEKSVYNLFNPTPTELMREFNTDRPDRTESPYTLDAGHFQVETDLAILSYDRSSDGTTTREWGFNVANLKVGLTNRIDLQAVVGSYVLSRTSSDSGDSTQSGFGDLTFRLKVNLLGNDGGPLAIGVMPFARIPTHAPGLGSSLVEGGLIFPIAVSLPNEWGMGMMFEIDANANDDDRGHHLEWISSITFGHEIGAGFEGYAEFFSQSGVDSWKPTVDFGLLYGVTPNLNLDAGVNIGVTPAADDLNPFLGLSLRL